jgi:hypothetical protein
MSEEKKVNMNDSMDEVNGGIGGSGFYMTVGNCNGGYLALRPQPAWNQYQELAQLYPGYQVLAEYYNQCRYALEGLGIGLPFVYPNQQITAMLLNDLVYVINTIT